MRARSVQAIDEAIGRIRATLRKARVARNTFVVFGSDNGFHLGQHRLIGGKRTAFDHDVRVPLVVVGPAVRRGGTTSALTGTVDLAPTFEAWAHAPADPRRDGRSLTPLLDGRTPKRWRRALLIEHTNPGTVAGDPDIQQRAEGVPSSYTALRTRHTTYVEYANGDREFYDRRRDPGELHNRAARLTRSQRARSAPRWRATGTAAARPTAGQRLAGLVDDRPRLLLRRGRADGRRRRRRRRVGGIHDGSGPSAAGRSGLAGCATVRPFLGDARFRSTR